MSVRLPMSIRRRLSAGVAFTGLALSLGLPGAASAQVPYAADPDQSSSSAPTATGFNAIALGPAARADGVAAHAIGSSAIADGESATAVGAQSWASDEGSTALGSAAYADAWATALGTGTWASGYLSIAIGYNAFTLAERAVAIGYLASGQGEASIAIGDGAHVYSDLGATNVDGGIAIGGSTVVWGENGIALGLNAQAFDPFSIAMGGNALTEGFGSIGIGESVIVSGDQSLALGYGLQVQGERSLALGSASILDDGGTVTPFGGVIGDGGVGIGVGALVLYADNAVALGAGSLAHEDYTVSVGLDVTKHPLMGLDGSTSFTRRIVNVSDGVVAAGSSDAVTGGQLHTVVTDVAANATAITGLGGRLDDAEDDLSALRLDVDGFGSNLVLQDADDLTIAVAAATGGDAVSFSGTGGVRRLTGLGDGVVAESSTDAVTGGQLHLVITDVATNTAAISGLDLRLTDAEADLVALGGSAGGGDDLVLQDEDDLSVTVAAATGGTSINLAGTDGARRLTGLSAAALAMDGDAAVTTGQLFATHQAVGAALGSGAAFDANGAFTAPSYAILGSVYDNVGGALGALDAQVGANTADIDDLRINGGGGSGGPDPRDEEIAALRAQIQAMSAVLDRLEAGAISGGDASGQGTTAAGEGAVAQQYGDTAYGAGARATGDPSTAVGFESLAAGQHSTAVGGNAQATGALSSALGQAAVASGANSLALGQASQATHDDSIAIGQGVSTTRAGQVAIGSTSNTYTLAGLHSDASRASQSGPTYVVTTDASGNLATTDMTPWLQQVDVLEGRMDMNDMRWRAAERTLDRHADGVAMAIALGAQVLQPGQNFAMSGNLGVFDGNGAIGFGAVGRVNHNVTLNIGVGTGFRTGVASGRIGMSVGW